MPAQPDWWSLYPFESHYLQLDGLRGVSGGGLRGVSGGGLRGVSGDGLRYHYLDEGQGEPLLLVHGNPTWSFYWRELVKALRGRWRVIVPDHVGCGLSDKPQRYEYRLARHVDNLRRLIERLDLRRITLLAHDWGGAIGLGAAVAEPERFSRFVLFNTAAFRSPSMPWRIRVCRAPLVGKLAVQGLNAFARAALFMAVEHRTRLTPAIRAGLLAPYDRWSHRIALHRFVLDIPMRPAHPSYQTLTKIELGLAKLRERPVSLIWGMRDWCFTPAFLDRFGEVFPKAEVHRIDDAGHYVIEDAHERIVPLVEDFLERHPIE